MTRRNAQRCIAVLRLSWHAEYIVCILQLCARVINAHACVHSHGRALACAHTHTHRAAFCCLSLHHRVWFRSSSSILMTGGWSLNMLLCVWFCDSMVHLAHMHEFGQWEDIDYMQIWINNQKMFWAHAFEQGTVHFLQLWGRSVFFSLIGCWNWQFEHVKQKSFDPEQHDLLITNTTSALKGFIGHIEQDHNRAVWPHPFTRWTPQSCPLIGWDTSLWSGFTPVTGIV